MTRGGVARSGVHGRRAALMEASRTFEGGLWLEWAKHATDEDLAKCGDLATKLDPYVCDAAPTSVFAGDDRSQFWRDMVDFHPAIIDFVRHLDHASRLEFFSHLVAFQRFICSNTDMRYASVVEQDRSSILYFILTESEENVQALVDLLDGMEHRRKSKLPAVASPGRGGPRARKRTSITQIKSQRRLLDSNHDPRVALAIRFNDLEDAVLQVETDRRHSIVFDADMFLEDAFDDDAAAP